MQRDFSTSLCFGTTGKLFTALAVYRDEAAHSAAMNMAIDEALLELATMPAIRFYRWRSPALSFGYFGRFGDVAAYAPARELIRRWTGGGIVFHGDDLTYSIVIPATDSVFAESSLMVYEKIHRALGEALLVNGLSAKLATVAALSQRRKLRQRDLQIAPAVIDRRYSNTGVDETGGYNCFESPVHADVMIDGRKIAGAAQRRTRRGLLQQGSIQGVDFPNCLREQFECALSAERSERTIDENILSRAGELVQQKYATDFWMRRH